MNIISRAGKPFVEGADLVQAFLGVGMSGVEAKASSLALAIKTVMYNSYNCQGVIAISRPVPTRFGYSPGGGTIARCQEVYLVYEISLDGGSTWIQVEAPATICTEDEA